MQVYTVTLTSLLAITVLKEHIPNIHTWDTKMWCGRTV